MAGVFRIAEDGNNLKTVSQGVAIGKRKDSEQEEDAHGILTVLRETAESVLKSEDKRKSLEG